MENHTNKVNEIVLNIRSLLDVERIYCIQNDALAGFLYRFIIVIGNTSKDIGNQIQPIVFKLQQEHRGYCFKIYSLTYINTQLKELNVYFLNNCLNENLVFQNLETNLAWAYPIEDRIILSEKIKKSFKRDIERLNSFKKGVAFFRKRENLAQSAFMLHQCFEQGYRILERIVCGKVKVCHSIKNHQAYVLRYLPSFDGMFHIDNEQETTLLDKLDAAYSESRYTHNYQINKQEIEKLAKRLNKFIGEVKRSFNKELCRFKQIASNQETFNSVEMKADNIKDRKLNKHPEKEQMKILEGLKAQILKTGNILKPTQEIWNEKPMYKAEIRMSNEFELILKIESIIQLCVFTLEGEGTYSSETLYEYNSDQPSKHRNSAICTALELVLTMLPKREMISYREILERLVDYESNS